MSLLPRSVVQGRNKPGQREQASGCDGGLQTHRKDLALSHGDRENQERDLLDGR